MQQQTHTPLLLRFVEPGNVWVQGWQAVAPELDIKKLTAEFLPGLAQKETRTDTRRGSMTGRGYVGVYGSLSATERGTQGHEQSAL